MASAAYSGSEASAKGAEAGDVWFESAQGVPI